MELQVGVDVRGTRRAAGLCDRLSRRLADGTPALRGIVDSLTDAQAERFAGRGRRWRRLSPETVRIDRQQGRDPRPLILTGTLMRSLTVRGAPGQLVHVGPTSLTFGSRVFYAKFQKHMGRNPVGLTRLQRLPLIAELRRLLIED